MKFRVIAAEKASIPIARSCSALGVSESGFHAWQNVRPVRYSVRKWCFWHILGRNSPPQMRPMAARA